jgi:hypothetical protein
VPLRLDPAVYDALAHWAADDLRSVNAQIEVLLRDALRGAGRLPATTRPIATRARPVADLKRAEERDGDEEASHTSAPGSEVHSS